MLYDEFLRGTEMPANKETYSLYKRVNTLYMENNSWNKEDAYRYACKLARKENLISQYPFTIHNITTGKILRGVTFQKNVLDIIIDRINNLFGFEPEKHYINKLARYNKCILYSKDNKTICYYLQRYDYNNNLYFITK